MRCNPLCFAPGSPWASHAIHSTHVKIACARRKLVLHVALVSVGADVQDRKAKRESTVVTWSSAATSSSAKDDDLKEVTN